MPRVNSGVPPGRNRTSGQVNSIYGRSVSPYQCAGVTSMAGKQKITVKSYVHYRGGLVEFKDLPPEDRERAATELALKYFNTLFAGRATFAVAEGKDRDRLPRPGRGVPE